MDVLKDPLMSRLNIIHDTKLLNTKHCVLLNFLG